MTTTTGSPLPLTTTFTPPGECLNNFWVLNINEEDFWANLGPGNTNECLPQGWGPSTYFSPGLVCPSGWQMATTSAHGAETIGTCCPVYLPSNWTFSPRPSSTSTTRPWQSSEACVFDVTTNLTYTYTHTNTLGYTSTAVGPMTAGKDSWNGYGVEMRWRSTDLSSAPATSTPSQTATPTAISGSSKKETGLSSGTKAGVGVGAAFGGILAIFAIAFLILRRRKRPETDVDGRHGSDGGHGFRMPSLGNQPKELAATELFRFGRKKQELASNPLYEKDGTQVTRFQRQEPIELDACSVK